MRPAGIGLAQVRLMIASMSRSYHMLIAPGGAGANGNAENGNRRQGRDATLWVPEAGRRRR